MALEVNDTHELKRYTATGGQTAFAVPFEFFADSDLKVYKTPNGSNPDDVTDLLTLTTHYTVTGAGVTGGGTVDLTAGASAGDVITIRRDMAVKRVGMDFQANGKLLSASLNEDLDRVVMMVQQLETYIEKRMMVLQDTDTTATGALSLPNIANRKGKYLYFDETTGDLSVTQITDATAISVTPFMQTVLDDATGLEALATLGAVGKQTIFIPASAMRPTVSNGCSVLQDIETTAGRPDMSVLNFQGVTSNEHAQFQVAFPKSWNEGTVTAKFFWTLPTAVSTSVVWGIQGVAVSDNETIDVGYGTAILQADTAQGAAEELYVSLETGAITIAGSPAYGDMCYFRVYRDQGHASDNTSADARLLGVQLFYTTDAGNDS